VDAGKRDIGEQEFCLPVRPSHSGPVSERLNMSSEVFHRVCYPDHSTFKSREWGGEHVHWCGSSFHARTVVNESSFYASRLNAHLNLLPIRTLRPRWTID